MRSGQFWRELGMAAESALDVFSQLIREKIHCGWSHKRISRFLQDNNPGLRGFSERSVRRFCHNHDIHRTPRIEEHALDDVVTRATSMVSSIDRPRIITRLRH